MAKTNEKVPEWVPLHAEAQEKYSRWYKLELNAGCEGQAKFLYEQLKARPSPWGKGLWKDAETERIAERCAQIFAENFTKCPNGHLIPQDQMEMVVALNDTGDLEDVEALDQIESEFACKIPEGFFQRERTFAEFIECIKDGRGKASPKKLKAKTCLGCVMASGLLALFLLAFPCYLAYAVYCDVSTGLSEGWGNVRLGSLVAKIGGVCFWLFALSYIGFSAIRKTRK